MPTPLLKNLFRRAPLTLMISRVVCVAAVVVSAAAARAQEPQVELLWPNGAPGAVGEEDADKPTLTIWRPEESKQVDTAIVVCPGGGYGGLAIDHEGKQIAEWLNSHGVTAVMLKYRLAPRYRHPAPLQDARRAIQTVRSRATDWGIAQDKIGIIGFSAGGHLASSTGVHFEPGKPDAKDPIERVSSRPDFMVLAYPVISFVEECTHKGSRQNLLGENPPQELVEKMSSERQVTQETPPTFLFHTTADTGVTPDNSILMYQALRKHGVPVEMHIYEPGPHGVGLAQKDPSVSDWPKRCVQWLKHRGVLAD